MTKNAGQFGRSRRSRGRGAVTPGRALPARPPVIGQRHEQADGQWRFRQRSRGAQKNSPVLLVNESFWKLTAKRVDQCRPAVKQYCTIPLGRLVPPEPDSASASCRLGQVGRFAPFQRFRQRSDAVRLRRNVEDQGSYLEKPFANQRRKIHSGRPRPQKAPASIGGPSRAVQRQSGLLAGMRTN